MTITPREAAEIAAANESGRQPVVLIHGLWLLAESWDGWRHLLEEQGYAAVAVDWPDDPTSVAEARSNPDVFAGKGVGQVADHIAEVITRLNRKPAVIGHSFGGLLAQIIAGRGLAAATVAIDPAPSRGVLPLPFTALKAAFPVLGNTANRKRAVTLTFDEFRYGFANAVSEAEARALYESSHVAAPGRPLFQAATANIDPGTEARADKKNPDRGPLLVLNGEKDTIVPRRLAYAAYKKQRKNPGVTEWLELPGRGHSLVFDSSWEGVAEAATGFLAAQGIRD
ncbi:alpha/beta hydrolase [Nocardioides cavernaquae]|uniref:Alpha/beta hydrolase n=1 Tax=Nocardioides cavernaquae TaxID=2321396 RepID=A0A3A5H435_9ACTN|nr:alpha/beta hydrolase [Nocardioides cavernaquae]RJS45493.1 alpha/beta hydrolase [Nocardioides cavernaquae]